MNICDLHTHHHPVEPGSAIVQLSLTDFIPLPGHYYSVGLHPWYIADDWRVQMAKLAVLALHPQVVMIGEAGMDKKNGSAPLEVQMEVFRLHVALSEMLHKPLIVHCVKAMDELLAIRKEMRTTQPWVLHGFRGGVEQWHQLSRAGVLVSLGRYYDADLVKQLPLSQLLLESDDRYTIDAVYWQVASDVNVNISELRTHVCCHIRNLLG